MIKFDIRSMLAFTITLLIIIESHGMFLPKRMNPYNMNEKILLDPKKRPFCNAFTGCGRKRSNLPALTPDGEEAENSINSLLELSEEPAVEDLSRQIMSEAKLWEAIQEANMEMHRRKHFPKQQQSKQAFESIGNMDDNVNLIKDDVSIARATCSTPPCYT